MGASMRSVVAVVQSGHLDVLGVLGVIAPMVTRRNADPVETTAETVRTTAETKCWRYFDYSIRFNRWFEDLVNADRALVVQADRSSTTIADSLVAVINGWRTPGKPAPSVPSAGMEELMDWLCEMPQECQTELLAGIADRTEAGLLVRFDWDEADTWSLTWIDMPGTGIAPVLLRGPSKWAEDAAAP